MLRILSFIILCAFSINLSVAAVPKETIKRIEQEAQKGDIKAQVMLGIGYYLGNELKQDYGKAKKWLTMASNKGNSDAQLFLGDMYLNGNGVEANLETAMDLFEKSANKGNVEAQNYMGQFYYQGIGVKQNYITAFEWFKNLLIKNSHQRNIK